MFDLIGNIAVLKQPLKDDPKKLVKYIIERHKYIKTILLQKTDALPPFRVPEYEILWGESITETSTKEFGLRFKVDVVKCYYSPRLSTERMRIAKQVKPNERVLVMFSGVNPYAIYIAKFANPKIVYAIELNPFAVKYALENVKLNKINNIITILGDVREVGKIISFLENKDAVITINNNYIKLIKESKLELNKIIYKINNVEMLYYKRSYKWYLENSEFIYLQNSEKIKIRKYNLKFDRIIMPLPKEADTFLDTAIPLISEGGVIHLYQFMYEEEFPNKTKEILDRYSRELKFDYEIMNIKKVGNVGTRQYRICIDFKVTKKYQNF